MIFCWAKKYHVPKLGVKGTVSRDPVAHFIESCMTGGTGGVGPVSGRPVSATRDPVALFIESCTTGGTGGVGPVSGGRFSPPQLGVCDAVRVRTPYSRPSSALIINTEKKKYNDGHACPSSMDLKSCTPIWSAMINETPSSARLVLEMLSHCHTGVLAAISSTRVCWSLEEEKPVGFPLSCDVEET
jgi:hypothetical protein